MIAIVNYGCGNVQAIANVYKRLNVPTRMATTPEDLTLADRVILPGVGAFDWAMKRFNESGMRATVEQQARAEGKPLLGICVGMQMLARESEEGRLPGLGWIGGVVRRFEISKIDDETHLPHMGWNDVAAREATGLFTQLDSHPRFYFLHSYYFLPDKDESVLAVTDYHGGFASGVSSANIYGVQFHPEKSHNWGIRLLKNFAEL